MDELNNIVKAIEPIIFLSIRILVIVHAALLTIFIIILFNKKRMRTFGVKQEFLSVISLYINGIGRLARYAFVVLLLLIIFNLLLIDEVLNYIKALISNYRDIFLIFIGACITSLFSFLSNINKNIRKKKADKNNNSQMIYYDLKSILFELELNKVLLSDTELSLKPSKLEYDKDWKNKYYHISSMLSYEHYKVLDNTYRKVKKINHFIENSQHVLARYNINSIITSYYNNDLIPCVGLNLKDVMVDLERITRNKKMKSVRYYKIFEYIMYLIYLRKHYIFFEKHLIDILKEEGPKDYSSLSKMMLDDLCKQGLKENSKKYINAKRSVYEVLNCSSQISRESNNYTIKESTTSKAS